MKHLLIFKDKELIGTVIPVEFLTGPFSFGDSTKSFVIPVLLTPNQITGRIARKKAKEHGINDCVIFHECVECSLIRVDNLKEHNVDLDTVFVERVNNDVKRAS